VKPRVNLADVLTHHHITPREAATLTLAVAHEWDRQRALYGPLALPEVGGIDLTERGEVVFLVQAPAGDGDDESCLSEFLAALLRLDGGPRPQLRGPLNEGFRATLARFAADDAETLRTLYWRCVTRREHRYPRRKAAVPKVTRRERRASPEQIAELRRSVRALEQRVFRYEYRRTQLRTALLRPDDITPIRWAVAAAVLLLILAGAFTIHSDATGPGEVAAADATPAILAEASAEQPPAVPEKVSVVDVAPSTTLRPAAAPRTRRAKQHAPKPAKRAVPSPSPIAAIAGGTRGIAWLQR
jgi:hypothetical protein